MWGLSEKVIWPWIRVFLAELRDKKRTRGQPVDLDFLVVLRRTVAAWERGEISGARKWDAIAEAITSELPECAKDADTVYREYLLYRSTFAPFPQRKKPYRERRRGRKQRLWTQEEDEVLRTRYHTMRVPVLAAILERTLPAIRMRANKMGLRKHASPPA
jgi:hypothetical protein